MSLCAALCLCTGHILPVQAQNDEQMRRLLDSVANPPLTPDKALRFDSERLDLGTFPEDNIPGIRFGFRNTGQSPLVITRVAVSCGCLRAEYDHAPTAPGAAGEIAVAYNPNGHVGAMSHSIFVYTDRSGIHPAVRLEVTGEVLGTIRHRGYPTAAGPLRLKRRSADFGRLGRNAVATERIACINDGKDTLTITAYRRLPRWAALRTEPQSIAPGAEADIAVTVDCSKIPADSTGVIEWPIYLEGVEAAVSERRIDMRLEIAN